MPSLVTHFYLADRVLDKLNDQNLANIIKKYKQEYTIGAQGPDLWLYHEGAPYSNDKNNRISNGYANLVHHSHINDFFESCLNSIKKCEDQDLKEAMLSYTLGHLCHWAMDSTCHPYVFYITNGFTKETKYWHVRYEEMVDNYIIDIMKKEKRKTYKSVRGIVAYDDMCDKAIQNIYIPALKDVYDQICEPQEVKQALKDFYTIVSFMNDRVGVIYGLLRIYELIKKDKWVYTSHFITEKMDKSMDILNLNKKKWCHPCDNTEIHDESFLELIDLSEDRALIAINLFNQALTSDNCEELLNFIGDRNYNSGRKSTEKMKYFEVIY